MDMSEQEYLDIRRDILSKFTKEGGEFDEEAYEEAVFKACASLERRSHPVFGW
jgi:hypothetical protein